MLFRKDSIWKLGQGDIELHKTMGQEHTSCSAELTTIWTGTLGVECRKRGLGTGFVRKSLEMGWVDKMRSQGSGSSCDRSRAVTVSCSWVEAWRAILGKSQNSELWLRISRNGDMAARTETVTLMNLGHKWTWLLNEVTFKEEEFQNSNY